MGEKLQNKKIPDIMNVVRGQLFPFYYFLSTASSRAAGDYSSPQELLY